MSCEGSHPRRTLTLTLTTLTLSLLLQDVRWDFTPPTDPAAPSPSNPAPPSPAVSLSLGLGRFQPTVTAAAGARRQQCWFLFHPSALNNGSISCLAETNRVTSDLPEA